ncbi:bifunctional non-homologous end joining protein LigD [Devosia sp. YR412]|uniref:ATP-dependent DNA ligase n=1 Tax=Devosia sp. YR412 TaxID=1881030 RepID=UPI0008B3A87E|nr:RNA ligase family protein [Devosia sp. YR412]SEP80618.1 bifunctional non-homologous end joining protein LigD [Devosia sp. YR412]
MPVPVTAFHTASANFILPQLAAFSAKPPQGAGWYYERKYDGYRLQVSITGGAVRFFTRSGIDVSEKLRTLLPALEALRFKDLILDAELCDGSENDRTDLGTLNQTFHHGGPFRLYVFDVLRLDGEDVSHLPLCRRKVLLASAIAALDGTGCVRLVPFQTAAGDALFNEMVENRHEGIIAKRASAPYLAGKRSSDWVKVKVFQEESYSVIGWQMDPAKSIVKSLLVASHQGDQWTYRGRVGTGWTSTGRRILLKSLEAVECETPYLAVPVRGQVRWTDGTRKVRVRFADISHNGILRHPRFISNA